MLVISKCLLMTKLIFIQKQKSELLEINLTLFKNICFICVAYRLNILIKSDAIIKQFELEQLSLDIPKYIKN